MGEPLGLPIGDGYWIVLGLVIAYGIVQRKHRHTRLIDEYFRDSTSKLGHVEYHCLMEVQYHLRKQPIFHNCL